MIKVEGLTKKFGNFLAVDNISFNVKPGEIFGFLGPNGAGKTTTIRIMASLISPSSGKVQVEGREISENAQYIRSIIGILTESPGLYERMSAYENLLYFAGFYNIEKLKIASNIEKFLKMFGLWERRNEMVAAYSKGMKQKLAISRALIHEPKILFLDEPTAGLDPESAYMVRNFIESLRNNNTTVFLCTHNLEEAQVLCSTICIIKTRIIKTASVYELQNSSNLKTFELVTLDEPSFFENILKKFGPQLDYSIEGNKVFLKINDFQMTNPALIKDLAAAGIKITAFNEIKESLEDIYLKLIRA